MTRFATLTLTMMETVRRMQRERNALVTRVRILEAAMAGIERETELALEEPAVAFLATRRVAALARQCG